MNDFELKKTQILDRVDIVDLVSEHVTLKRTGKRWVGLCPFHHEKTPSFTVSPERASFKCFGCGKGGDVFTFVQQHENVSFMEAMQMLAERVGVDIGPSTQGAPGGIRRADLARANEWALRFFRSVLLHESTGKDARAYLARRGISDETSARFSIGLATENMPSLRQAGSRAGISESLLLEADLIRKSEEGRVYDTYRQRLMFPIRDATKRVVGFGGRTLVDDAAKYLNTRHNMLFDKGRGLYGIDLARQKMSELKRAVLVEGYTDCIAAHQVGFTETVATLGTALTEAQVDLVRRYCDEMILLFDSDEAGEAAADRAIRVALPRYVTVRLARIPKGKDPCEFLMDQPAEAFSGVLECSVDALEFKWSRTRLRYEGDLPDSERREAVLDFVRLVAEACSSGAMDAIQRGLIVNRIAKLINLDVQDVHALMVRTGRKRPYRTATAPQETTAASSSPPRDGEQAAWTDLLGVVLNEPRLLSLADGLSGVDRIADDRDRRIAEQVLALGKEVGELKLQTVLAECREAAEQQRVIELAQRGAERGNYEETMRVALYRIRRGSHVRAFESARREVVDVVPADSDSDEALKALQTIHGCLKELRHFAPQRLIRRHTGEITPKGTEHADEA